MSEDASISSKDSYHILYPADQRFFEDDLMWFLLKNLKKIENPSMSEDAPISSKDSDSKEKDSSPG